MSDTADENDVVEAPAAKPETPKLAVPPPAQVREDGRPKQPKRTSSRSAIMEGLKAMGALPEGAGAEPGDDDEKEFAAKEAARRAGAKPPAPAPAATPKPPAEVTSSTPAPPPAKSPDGPSWNEIMERDYATREKAREIADKERMLKPQLEALDLLQKDPIAWIAKHGGENFGSRYVAYVQNGGKPPPEERVASLEERHEKLLRELEDERNTNREDSFLSTHLSHFSSGEEAALLRGWYEPQEYRGFVQNVSRNVKAQSGKELTPTEATGTFVGELKMRLERLSKTSEGRQYLQSLIGVRDEPKTPPPATPKPPTSKGPRTLTSDIGAQGNPPPETRLRRRSERSAVIQDALKHVTSGD